MAAVSTLTVHLDDADLAMVREAAEVTGITVEAFAAAAVLLQAENALAYHLERSRRLHQTKFTRPPDTRRERSWAIAEAEVVVSDLLNPDSSVAEYQARRGDSER